MRFALREIRLNNGGYDRHARYFGKVAGSRVYFFESADELHSGYLRAADRGQAKEILDKRYPGARAR